MAQPDEGCEQLIVKRDFAAYRVQFCFYRSQATFDSVEATCDCIEATCDCIEATIDSIETNADPFLHTEKHCLNPVDQINCSLSIS